ncbi:MAG: GMC family oxidoreductase [Terriglobus roseus]|nr:GMC family oxidoreductase [Terriglobus roseus]
MTAESNSTAEYDYVIVGSGAGGGPLAARLALAGYSVLVLDAGDDVNDIYTNVPALHVSLKSLVPITRS